MSIYRLLKLPGSRADFCICLGVFAAAYVLWRLVKDRGRGLVQSESLLQEDKLTEREMR